MKAFSLLLISILLLGTACQGSKQKEEVKVKTTLADKELPEIKKPTRLFRSPYRAIP